MDLGNELGDESGKSFLEDEETLCLFLGHRFGKFEGSRFGKKIFPVFLLFFVYFDGLLKVIFVSSMKVFLGNEFGKLLVLVVKSV